MLGRRHGDEAVMWVVLLLQKKVETTRGQRVHFADGMIGFLPAFATLRDAKKAYPKADYTEVKEKAT